MVKKILVYNILLFFIFFTIFITSVYKIINKIENKIDNKFYNMQFNTYFYKTQQDLINIKNLLNNYYSLLQKQTFQKKEAAVLTNFKNIQNLIDILNNLNIRQENIILNQIILKNKENIKIINLNKEIIASKNILEISKKISLPCDPLKNYGLCKIKQKDKYCFVKYLPLHKLYLMSCFDNSLNKGTLLNVLKSFDNLIIIKDGKQITNNFNNKGFYIFEYFQPINTFFGKEILYSDLKNSQKFIKNFNNELKNSILKIFLLFIIVSIIIFFGFLIFFEKKLRLIDKYFDNLKTSNYKDNLTNLFNRKYLEEIDITDKTFAIIDLDNFKYINDTFGHETGDKVLKFFSTLLKKYLKDDIIIRWGGDEFIVVSKKNKEKIKEIVKTLNFEINNYQKTFDKKLIKKLSISAGICDKNFPYEIKFKNADLALYKVKKTKKGRALSYDEIEYIKIEN